MSGYKIIFFVLFILLFQYILTYYFGDIFLYIDELAFLLILPSFIINSGKHKGILLVLIYLVFKTILLFFFFWELRFQDLLIDFYFILKPLIFFWAVYFLFSNISLPKLKNIEKYFRYFFILTTFYGIFQFLAYYFLRITLPMQGEKFFQGADVLLSDNFSLTRASSIYGHALWFAYVCAFSGIFYLYLKKYLIVLLSLFGILVTFSRWALLLYLLGCFGIFIYRNRRKSILAFSIILPFIFLYLFDISNKIFGVYNLLWEGYNESSTKVYGITKAFELLLINPFGFGVGSFGTYSSTSSQTYDLIYFSSEVLERLSNLKSGIESFTSILAVQLGLDSVIIYFYLFVNRLEWSYSGLFFFLLILFPMVSIYTSLLLILSAFFITYIKHQESEKNDL